MAAQKINSVYTYSTRDGKYRITKKFSTVEKAQGWFDRVGATAIQYCYDVVWNADRRQWEKVA